jgi:polysaccharide biosynthesis protein PslG
VQADGPLTDQPGPYDGEWDRMVGAGVESVRLTFLWRFAQPVAGGPNDFTATDALVIAGARRHLQVFPNVWATPDWAADQPGNAASPVRDRAAYGRYLAALIGRYGPHGSLWAERPDIPKVPIRAWQIWNEPSMTRYWSVQPFAKSYVALLRAAYSAVKRADPHATVVTAGLPNESWKDLRTIYKAGGRGHFDAVGLHPYTGKPRNVIRLVELSRSVMRKAHDSRTPVWLTELSWPAALGKVSETHGFETTDRGQAAKLKDGLKRLVDDRKRLRIGKVIWYTWLSVEGGENSFAWSGLRRIRGSALLSAPALSTFRSVARRLEGCSKLAGNASRCA